MSEKTYGDIACEAWCTRTNENPWERTANAVIAEYERREFETVYLVKDSNNGLYLMPTFQKSVRQSDAMTFRTRGQAISTLAMTQSTHCKVVRIRRRRKP